MTVSRLLELTGPLKAKQGVIPRQMNQEAPRRRFDALHAASTCGNALLVFVKDLEGLCVSNVEKCIFCMRNSEIGHEGLNCPRFDVFDWLE